MHELKVINCRLTRTEHGQIFDIGSMADFFVLPDSTQVFKKVGDVGLYEHVGVLNEPLGEYVWDIIYGKGAKHDNTV